MNSAVREILRKEGLAGFFRGTVPATMLWASYSAINLPIYTHSLKYFEKRFDESTTATWSRSTLRAACSFAAGAAGTVIATVLTYPFDIIRTQWVYQDKPADLRMPSLVKNILRQDGLAGFFHGLSPALIQVIPRMGLSYLTYDVLKQDFLCNKRFGTQQQQDSDDPSLSFAANLVAGGTAGFFSKLVVYPLDTAKRRLQVYAKPGPSSNTLDAQAQNYSGLISCMRKMYVDEGLRSWFKGIGPNLVKNVVATAVMFATYDKLIET